MPTLSPLRWLMLGTILGMLGACASPAEWARRQTLNLGYDYQPAGEDEVHALGRLSAAMQTGLSPQHLILMGQRYWYVLDEKDSRQLQGLLDAGLSGRFQRYAFGPGQDRNALPVRIRSDQASRFNSKFCLIYRIRPDAAFEEQTQESERLRRLNFAMTANQTEWGTDAFRLNRCFNLNGTLYARPPADTQWPEAWTQSIPLNLTVMRPRSLTAALQASRPAANEPVPQPWPAGIHPELTRQPVSQWFSD
ncbi:MAG: hypothetical protein Q4B17_04610 [Lautropia sp.]|nr:hypothetical protein [Lautropia sp.]